MEMDVSIIYVNYFTSHLILNSIKSVTDHLQGISYEIIVVDNNSEKDIEGIVSPIIPNDIPVRFILLPENIGYGKANNAGASIARGKCLFFLNPDTLLLNDAVRILYDYILRHPDTGICGANLYDINKKPIFSFRKIFPGALWDFHELTRHIFKYPLNKRKSFFNFNTKPLKVAYISGADLMIRKNVFKEANGFSEELFMYWDDVDICKKITELGLDVVNVPSAKICHLESRSFERCKMDKTELQEKYRIIYLKRNIGKYEYFISNLLYFLFLQSRSSLLAGGKKKEYYKRRKSLFLKFLKGN